jgi:DNA-binding HxlR family transcriptional regulator
MMQVNFAAQTSRREDASRQFRIFPRKSRVLGVVMLGKLYSNQDCAAARALEIVGERWSLLILRDALFRNSSRFSEFERTLGIAPNILAKRLESFVEAGLMRVDAPVGRKDQRRYLLTESGRDFVPILMALTQWGEKWVGPGPVDFINAATGEDVEVRVEPKGSKSEPGPVEVAVRLREACKGGEAAE